ncbi:MAG: phosphopentomutase [Bacteroidota bacterium]
MAPPLFVTIVLDGVGIGRAPDAALYGDAGTHTLAHVCAVARPALPNLTRLGLGNLDRLPGVPPVEAPAASTGVMVETSAGKDSTTGHWELAGLPLDAPFPTYPDGFPPALVDAFLQATGCAGILAGVPASGTAIIDQHGAVHLRTSQPIVYTSADSVFQIAAHTDVIPLDRLYDLCRIAREEVCVGPHAVGRVIARPFVGQPGAFARISEKRRDFALAPPTPPIQAQLQGTQVRTVAVGKIGDLFANVGFDTVTKTKDNAEGVEATLAAMREAAGGTTPTFIWTNLVDFDQEYGHRNNPDGFARALEAFDAALPTFEAALPAGARLVLTADHGNDPTTPGTDHTRERVPLLVLGGSPRVLGTRATFADHAATVADYFGLAWTGPGQRWAH